MITATTPSKLRTNLTKSLKAVTEEQVEIHIVLSSGKNAVLVSEDELNYYRKQAKRYERYLEMRYAAEHGKHFDDAEAMHRELLGELYDQLPE